jgi:hypothetical protein
VRIRSAAGFAALLFALSGCAKIPIATQWKLRSFKLETADLRPLRVAVRAPNWIIPTPDSGKILLTYWREGDEGSRRTTTFKLKRANYPGDREALMELAGAEPMAVFEIDRRDLALAAEAQADARRRKQESPSQNHAEMTIDRAGCRANEAPPGPMPFDLYVHTDDAIGWLPVLHDYDLRPDAGHEKEFLEKFAQHVPLCGKLADRLDPPAVSR